MNTATIGYQQKPRNVPTRSSSVPVMNSDKLNSDLLHLNQMGFKDNVKNQAALHQANGNLSTAIDILTRNTNNVNNNDNNIIQQRETQDSLTIDQKLVQLRNMGYTNIELNRDILRRTGGNVDVAVTLLKSNSTTTTSSLSQPVIPFNPTNNNLFSNTTATQQQQQQSPIFKNGKIISNSNNNQNNNNNQVGQLLDTNTQNFTTNNIFSLQQQQAQQQQQLQLQQQQQQLLQQQLQQQQQQLQQQSFSLQSMAPVNANPLSVSTPLNPFGQNLMSSM